MLEEEELERLRLGAITAIDGLWFLAVERKLGFDEAFEIDLEVWTAYGLVQLKRLLRMRGMDLEPGAHDLGTVNSLIEAMCEVDGTECAWELESEDVSEFTVTRCPWWENLKRSGRSEKVNCEVVDNTIFKRWLEALDPAIEMEIALSRPRGDDKCSWTLRRHRV